MQLRRADSGEAQRGVLVTEEGEDGLIALLAGERSNKCWF